MKKEGRYSTAIDQWPREDRPREKLVRYGERALSNSELLAILIGSGVRGRNAVDLAREILAAFKTFRRMGDSESGEWQRFHGLGPAKTAQIRAALEIGRRFREDERRVRGAKIRSSADAVAVLMPQMRDLPKEIFKTIYLNASHHVLQMVDEARGTVNYTTPIVREIFHKALQLHAVSVICAHNHPSGDTAPSREDREFTRRLAEAGRIMQIKVLDHVIIGDNTYFSFADEGYLT
ncbi:MAG: DNA repair protein RadC [Candidatus Omnitrophica bacterium]|nr:DNA repair protein RadC [Candidatus Omnitrophota bacterium]MCB9719279.1 DNA repair protein RadC [Candidatus Omnitrophota bacterium]